MLESKHKINVKGYDSWCGSVWALIGLILAIGWCYARERDREKEKKDKEERNRVETHDMSCHLLVSSLLPASTAAYNRLLCRKDKRIVETHNILSFLSLCHAKTEKTADDQ